MQKVNNTNLCPTGIYLYVEDCDATYNRVLQEGATSLMEPANQFYGDRSSGVKNQFANQWWIATRKEDLSPEEYTKRKEYEETTRKTRAESTLEKDIVREPVQSRLSILTTSRGLATGGNFFRLLRNIIW
jgi:uncharacterized protein YbcI